MFLPFDSVILLLGIFPKKVWKYAWPSIIQDKETAETM